MRVLFRAAALATVSAAALILAAPEAAQAGSFSIRAGQSAEGVGLSFAGSASGGIGLGSIAFNPAAITMFPGRTSQVNLSYILPQAEFEPLDATTVLTSQRFGVTPFSGDIGLDGAFVPASYSAFQVNERIWVGIATGAPFGLNSKPENQFYGGQVYGTSSKVRTLSAAPTVGVKLTDWLSIGGAAQIQYFKTTLKQSLTPALLSPRTILEGDDTAVGWRVGATITPAAGTTLGIAYRSSIRHTLEGDFTSPARLNAFVFPGENPIKANLNLPDFVTISLSQQITPDLQLHLNGEWENWSRFKRIPVVLQNSGVPLNGLNFEYDDGWFFSGGLEYTMRPGLIVRAGVGYELSPVNDRVRTPRISDNDRLWTSIGVGWQVTNQIRLDLSYAHLFVKEAPVFLNATSGNPSFNPAVPVVYNVTAEPSVDIVSASLTYRWDTPVAAAVPAAPIVRKY